jgi:hypothetical protein
MHQIYKPSLFYSLILPNRLIGIINLYPLEGDVNKSEKYLFNVERYCNPETLINFFL